MPTLSKIILIWLANTLFKAFKPLWFSIYIISDNKKPSEEGLLITLLNKY
jgi:hypothetical protein